MVARHLEVRDVMGTGTQRDWQHTLTKTNVIVAERINLTFRFIPEATRS
jgi:hypothetical protein